MDIETYRRHCLGKSGVTEEFPFGEATLVFKVMGKMFALSGVEDFSTINLKVDPEVGVELREKYTAVKPGYHMNKKHWITIMLDGSISDKLIFQWIDNSYNLVVSALPKTLQISLKSL